MQGWRPEMEDAHFTIGSLRGKGWEDTAAFGVMDGHGGHQVAHFCKRLLPQQIAKGPSQDPKESLMAAFQKMDELLMGGAKHLPEKHLPVAEAAEDSGCTCIVSLVQPDTIIVANAGDSRAVLCRAGKAVSLSEDHKPHLEKEHERIRKAGGKLTRTKRGANTHYRLNGDLNLSRAIGDLQHKRNPKLKWREQAVVSTPDVVFHRRSPEDEFLLMACDGIWDCLENQEAVDLVREMLPDYLDEERPFSGILEDLMSRIISSDLEKSSGRGGDNMTIILIVFGEAGSYAERVAPRSGGTVGATALTLQTGATGATAFQSPAKALHFADCDSSLLASSTQASERSEACRGCLLLRQWLYKFCSKPMEAAQPRQTRPLRESEDDYREA